MKTLINLAVLAAVLIIAGCSFAACSGLRDECGPWVDTFFQRPLKEQIATFDSYSLQNQYQIFICGNQAIHPPAIYLATPFAKQGAAAVPLLEKELAQAHSDQTVRDIVLVFAEMQRQRSYDVSKDTSLMRLIAKKVNGMHDPEWKAVAQGNVDKIRRVSK